MSGVKDYLCVKCGECFVWAPAYSRHFEVCNKPFDIALIARYGRVEVNDNGCWIWGRKLNKLGGYPTSTKLGYIHRLVYVINTGDEDIDEYDICHECDTPPCMNPDHLFKGTRQENMLDGVFKNGHWTSYVDSATVEAWKESTKQGRREYIARLSDQERRALAGRLQPSIAEHGHWTTRATDEKLQQWKDVMQAGRIKRTASAEEGGDANV